MFCKAYWATPFKMHFGFRPLFRRTFAELWRNFGRTFAKIPLSADPSHQQGAHQRKSKHQWPWCLALAKSRFWKLGCCIWNLFLETSESNVKVTLSSTSSRCKEVRQDHGIWLTFGSLAATYGAVPFSCRTPGGRRW